MIETLAKIFSDTGGIAGLIVFGFFAVIIGAMLIVGYIALHILASLHDLKETAYHDGLLKERRTFFRIYDKNRFIRLMTRRIRGKL